EKDRKVSHRPGNFSSSFHMRDRATALYERNTTMNPEPLSRWRIALNIRLLDDVERQNTLAGINKVAPQSVLVQIPSIAASFAALQTKGTTFSGDLTTAAAALKVYKAASGALKLSRAELDRELDALKTLVERNGKSEAEIVSMGFLPLLFSKASR